MRNAHVIEFLDLLRVIRSEANENDDTEDAADEFQLRRMEEQVDNACDDDSKQSHQEQIADGCKVAFGDHSIDAHDSKSPACDKERRGDGTDSVAVKYG